MIHINTVITVMVCKVIGEIGLIMFIFAVYFFLQGLRENEYLKSATYNFSY